MTANERDGCLSADALAMAARGELDAAAGVRVADHLAACPDCAEEFQLIRPLQAWSERTAAAYGRPSRPVRAATAWLAAWQFATALLLLAAGALLTWNLGLRRTNQDLMARAGAPAPPAVAPTPEAPAVGAEVNVPIVDLQAEAVRSGGPAATIARVAADVNLATLILSSDNRDSTAAFGIDITDETGRSVWQSSALRMTPFNTFTIAISPARLGPGLFQLQLFRVNAERKDALERYSLRIESRR